MYLIVFHEFSDFLLFGPWPLLKIVLGQFRPGLFIEALQLEDETLIDSVPKVDQELFDQFGHAEHLAAVFAVELRVASVRPIIVIAAVVIALKQLKV